MLFNSYKSESQSYSTDDKNLYIFEYYPKIYGQAILCFLETQDANALQISFKIYYTKDKICKVIKTIGSSEYKYQKKEDGNVYVYGLKMNCYSSKDFKDKRINNDNFYKLLSSNFLDINNKDRLAILNKFLK